MFPKQGKTRSARCGLERLFRPTRRAVASLSCQIAPEESRRKLDPTSAEWSDRSLKEVKMEKHKVVSKEEWLVARKEHLIKEKEFTRLRDELSRQRRELPWEAVKKEYVFEGPTGKQTLPELFEGRSELVVYHFMYPPSWSEGCKSCSFWADNYNGIIVHGNHRDVTMVTISKAPFEKLEAFRKRM